MRLNATAPDELRLSLSNTRRNDSLRLTLLWLLREKKNTDAYPSALPFVRDLFLHLKQTSHTHKISTLVRTAHTPMAYATFVTSHTLVISNDTNPQDSQPNFHA